MTAVPILAFHAVGDGPAPLVMPLDRFRMIVEQLRRAGVTAVHAETAGEILAGRAPAPERPVVFSFDDGYRSVAHLALPVLAQAGFVATTFVISNRLGAANDWDPGMADTPAMQLMSETDVRALVDAGWEIGSHGRTHRSLPTATAAELHAELADSREEIRHLTGTPPRTLAYPYGHHDQRVRDAAGSLYEHCFTIGAHLARSGGDRTEIDRIEAWYLQRPIWVRALHHPTGPAYLAARRAARSIGRVQTR